MYTVCIPMSVYTRARMTYHLPVITVHLSIPVCRVLGAGRECAIAFKALLELVHQIVLKPTQENKKKLPTFSKEVATSVGEVVQAAEAIRGGH